MKTRNTIKTRMRRLLAVALTFMLIVGMLPISAFAVSEFTYVAPEISGSGMGSVYVYVQDSGYNEMWPGYRYLKPGDKIDASKGLRIKVFPYCSDLNSIKLQIGTGSGSSFSLENEKRLFKPDPEDGYVYTVKDLSAFTNSEGYLLRVSAVFEFRPEFAGICHILEKESTGGGFLGLYDYSTDAELKRGYRGDTIEAYVVPDEGYTLSGLYLLKRDDPLPTENFEITSDFTPINERQYTFTMPDHSAKVYAVFTLESAHSHRWNYRSEGNQIIASCDCGKQPRLLLSARGHFYNGEKGMAWLYLDSWKFTGDGEPLPVVSEADIVYDDTPEKAGKHTVTLTVGGATAEATYTINKAHAGIYVIDQSYPYDGELHGPGVKTYTDPDEIARYVTVSTLRNGNKLASVTVEGQGREIGEYPLKITDYRIENAKGEDVSENYSVTCVDGTLHIDTTAEKYDLWVGGIRVTGDNAADIFGDGDAGASAIYNPGTKTLILNNCVYEGNGYKIGEHSPTEGEYAAIYSKDQDLTIRLLGANTIKNTAASTDIGDGIYIQNGDLTIDGDGRLTVIGNSNIYLLSVGIYTYLGDLTISGGTVFASGDNGMVADGNNIKLTVTGGVVTASGTQRALSGILSIADGMEVIAGDSEETAIDVDKTNFETDHLQCWVKIAPAGAPQHIHSLEPVAAVAATCEADGHDAYWVCTDCGDMFSDAAGNNKISEAVVIPSLGHDWSMRFYWGIPAVPIGGTVTYEKPGVMLSCSRDMFHQHIVPADNVTFEENRIEPKCEEDGSVVYSASADYLGAHGEESKTVTLNKLGHDWGEWTVTKEATAEEEGERIHSCMREGCGKSETQTIPKVQTFTISFDAGDGSGEMASVQVANNEDWQLPQSTFTHPNGKAFKAWSADGSEYKAGQKYTPTADITFTALWSEAKYTGPSGVHYVEVGDSKTFTFKANEGWFYQEHDIQGLSPKALQFLSISGIDGGSNNLSDRSSTEFTVTFAPKYFPEGSVTMHAGGYTYTITHCETTIRPNIYWRNTGVGDYDYPLMDKFVVVPGRTSIDLGGMERYEIVLNPGAELQLNPVVRNIRNQVISKENGYTVDIPQLSFKSSNEDVATVSADGKITPEGGGKADIIISFIGNASYKAAEYVTLKVVVQEPVSVKGTVVWDDGDNIDGRRPEKTWLMIRRKDGETVVDKDGYTVAKEVEIAGTQGTKLSCTWENLPKYKQGTSGAELIEYEVVETSGDGMVWTPGGYEKLASGDMASGFIITNRYIPKQTDIVVTKVWEDDGNAGGKRPESVTLHLDQKPFVSTEDDDIKDVAAAVTADEAGGWKALWQGLPYNEKKSEQFTGAITYKVREDATAGYTGSVTQTDAGLRASIVWADGVNEEDKPASITATLISETGDATSRIAALSAANNWTCIFDGLNPNQAASYEVSLSNSSLANHPERGYLQLSVIREYTLTNTLIPTIELTIDTPKCGTVVDEDKSYPFNSADGSREPEAQSNRPVGTILTNGWEFVKSTADPSVDWLKWGQFTNWNENPTMVFPITLTGGSSYNALGRIVPAGGATVPAAVSLVVNGQELPQDRVKVDNGIIYFAASIEAEHTLEKLARKDSTCSAAGYEEYWKCTSCGKLYSDENGQNEIAKPVAIEKLPHTPGEAVRENEVPASCSAEGSYDEVVYCMECRAELSRTNKKIDKLAHTPGTAVRENEVPASCSTEGSYDEVIYCTECKAELSRTNKKIDKLPHTPGEAVRENEVPASCSAEGSYDEVVYCTECKAELSRETKKIDKLPHTPGEAVRENEVPATCETEGSYDEVVYCTECKAELSRENKKIDKLPHTPGEAVRENEVPATCETEGSYDEVVYCTECKEELSRETKKIDKLPHTPGEAVHEKEVPASCSAEGSYDEVVYCTECKAELSRETKTIDKLPHTPGEAVHENGVPATCTKEGSYDEVVYCTECMVELSRETKTIDMLPHTPGEAVHENEVPASCSAEGSYDEVVYCTECKVELSRETKIIDKLPHTAGEAVHENEVPASCSAEGSYDEVVYCTECKVELSRDTKLIGRTGHNWGRWIVTKEATETEEGVEKRTCTRDASHTETRSIPKLEPSNIFYRNKAGDGGEWTKGSEDTLGFTFERSINDAATFDLFTEIKVDEETVPGRDDSGKVNYTTQNGSVIIELQPSFLETLSVGVHTLTVQFEDGSATAEFTVNPEQQENPDDNTNDSTNPNTNDTDNNTSDNTNNNMDGNTSDNANPSTNNKTTPTKPAPTSGKTTTSVPKTGDESNSLLWFWLLAVSIWLVIGSDLKKLFVK